MPIPAPLAAAFAALGLAPDCIEHPPFRTVEEGASFWASVSGAQVKNLFLKDAGGQLWLVVVPGERMMDVKVLASVIGSKRLSFGSSETLEAVLGVMPGSVTPLAVMNDAQRKVRVVVHSGLMAAERLLVHPLVNTATVPLTPGELRRFIIEMHGAAAEIDLTPAFRSVA